MKKLYSIYYFFFLFTLVTTIVFTRTEKVSAFVISGGHAYTAVQSAADKAQSADTISRPVDSVNTTAILLKDNRKNKPKIFQDPVKTYDDRQLLFFTTFGFDDDYSSDRVAMQDVHEPEKIISNFKVYPNPLYVNTQNLKISYNIKKNALITVKMLDVLGNEVSTLLVQLVGAGSRTNEFNISSKVSGGFYFIRLSADADHVTRKISVVQ